MYWRDLDRLYSQPYRPNSRVSVKRLAESLLNSRCLLQVDVSTLIWDNRTVLHNASGGYDGHRRLLHRLTIAGSQPQSAF